MEGGAASLVPNANFESAGNWSEITWADFPGTSFYRSNWGTATPHSGTHAIAISNHAYAALEAAQINVSPNTQHDAYAWVRGEIDAEDSWGQWILKVLQYDSAGVYLSSVDVDSGGMLSTAWEQKGGRFTTTANTGKVVIRLYNYMNSGWVAYDDVTLRPVVTYNLSYDAENRLTGVSGAATATFVYDGDGKRVKATVGGVTTDYISNHYDWNGSTSTMIKYYCAGAARVALRVGSNTPK